MSVIRDIELRFRQEGAREAQDQTHRVERAVDRVADASRRSAAADAAARGSVGGLTEAIRQKSLAMETAVRRAEDLIKGLTALQSVAGAVMGITGIVISAFTFLKAKLAEADKAARGASQGIGMMEGALATMKEAAVAARVKVEELTRAQQDLIAKVAAARGVLPELFPEHEAFQIQKLLEDEQDAIKGVTDARAALAKAEAAQSKRLIRLEEQHERMRENAAARQSQRALGELFNVEQAVRRGEEQIAQARALIGVEADNLIWLRDRKAALLGVTTATKAQQAALEGLSPAAEAYADALGRVRTAWDAIKGAAKDAIDAEIAAENQRRSEAKTVEASADAALASFTQHEIAKRDIQGQSVEHLLTDAQKLARARAAELDDLKRQREEHESFRDTIVDTAAATAAGMGQAAAAAWLAGESVKEAIGKELDAMAVRNLGLALEMLARAAAAAFIAPAAVPGFLNAAALHGAAAGVFRAAGKMMAGGGGGGGGGGSAAPARPEPARPERERADDRPTEMVFNINFAGRPISTDRDIADAVTRSLNAASRGRAAVRRGAR
ncbi:MAG: hypothetical protein Q8Q14_00505 [Gemmatimonadales bacterium]|nr:hypothetical protein [Gemmatimonadales bacterium]